MERISSRQNPIVKRFREVAHGSAGGEWMLLDGEHLIREALASGVHIDVAAVTAPVASGRLAPLIPELQRAGARVLEVNDVVLAALSPVRQPSGLVAIASRRNLTSDEVLANRPAGETPLVLMLSDVQDPGNVGAIVRAAESGGATGVIAGDGSADPFGWKALRGAMGSTLRLPVAARGSLGDAVRRARAEGLRLFAATARNGTPLPRCDLRGAAAILLGGEGAGLPPHLIEAADERMTIPMQPPVESLNVAIAAALIVYEAWRQRRQESHVAV